MSSELKSFRYYDIFNKCELTPKKLKHVYCFSDPTPEKTELLPIKWEPVTKNSPRYYLDIESKLTLDQRPFQKRLAFWDLFLKAYGEFEFGFDRENGTL